ncbi:MAG: D-alanyl-D-alanine carboxypeptidase/D-alanyl-D-alanine-endopeptidase [Dermatophilaceae bacterium]
MTRVPLAAATVLALLVGYLTADVFDVVPGMLTRVGAAGSPAPDGAPSPLAGSTSIPAPSSAGTLSSAGPPSPVPPGSADLLTVSDAAPLPAPTGLARAVAAASTDPAVADGLGVSVRDGITGGVVWQLDAGRPRVPASTAKVMAALAVADSLDLDATMPTTVVAAPGSDDVVLVARGDTLLAPGAGDLTEVAGRAGLADLADQVAGGLRATGRTSVRLRLDLSYAPGPRLPATWRPADVRDGFGGPVVMTGLTTTRAVAGRAGPGRPEYIVAATFATRLRERGITTSVLPVSAWRGPLPAGATILGQVESASYADLVGLALATSDNTLTENLVRQAVVAAGRSAAEPRANADFIVDRLRARGVAVDGLRVVDASGLSPGQAVSATTLSGVLAVGAAGDVPGFDRVLAGLPVAGLSGTLASRFDDAATGDVAGVPRAKTGTLRAGSSLAGTTVTADGRPLVFAVMVDGFPQTYDGTRRARVALDRITAAITRCGCR